LLLKLFIGYLINKEITEACIRIAMLITISGNVFFTQKGIVFVAKPNCNFSNLEKKSL